MKILPSFRTLAVSVTLLAASAVSHASVITAMTGPDSSGKVSYNGTQRTAWLSSSTEGWVVGSVTGTPQAADVGSLFGGTWTNQGSLTAPGTNGYLTASLDSGSSWGNGPLSGDWSLGANFWDNYTSAVISIHVGNGNGDPDWFLWKLTPDVASGDFYYRRITGGGGGLSNMFLWAGDKKTTRKVPDSGYTVMLVGAGLLAVGLFRRKLR